MRKEIVSREIDRVLEEIPGFGWIQERHIRLRKGDTRYEYELTIQAGVELNEEMIAAAFGWALDALKRSQAQNGNKR